jgi:type II restriction enzyme
LLEYSSDWSITGLRAVHHSLITEHCVEKRKPLAPTARRAGWIGCNLLLTDVAREGQINVYSDGEFRPTNEVRKQFAKLQHLSGLPLSQRTWAASILAIIDRLPQMFELSDVYAFESELAHRFPRNQHVRPKIRQQLQFLRDAGIIRFLGRGIYERASTD